MKKIILTILLFIIIVNITSAQNNTTSYKTEVLKEWANELGYNENQSNVLTINSEKNKYLFYISEKLINKADYESYYSLHYDQYHHPEIKKAFAILAQPGEKKKLEALFNELKNIDDINTYYEKAEQLIKNKYKTLRIGTLNWETNDNYYDEIAKAFKKLKKGEHSAVAVLSNYISVIYGCLDVTPEENISFEQAFDEIKNKVIVSYIDGYNFKQKYLEYENKYEREHQKPDAKGFVIIDGELVSYVGNATNVEIPKEVRKICNGAFSKQDSNGNFTNSNIRTITCYDNLRVLEDFAFEGCINLQEILLPKTLEKCSGLSFFCRNLEKITILGDNKNGFYTKDGILYKKGDGVVRYPPAKTSLDNFECSSVWRGCFAFNRCKEYHTDRQPYYAYICSYHLWNAQNLEKVFANITYEEDKYLNKSFSNIYKYAFAYCYNLKECDFSTYSTPIRVFEGAFKDDKSLQKIRFNNYVDTIDDTAFKGCIDLREVQFNYGVKHISKETFKDCNELEKIYILKQGNQELTIDDDAFTNKKYLTIYTDDSTVYGWCKSHNVKVEIYEK